MIAVCLHDFPQGLRSMMLAVVMAAVLSQGFSQSLGGLPGSVTATYRIAGRAINGGTGSPIAQARVALIDSRTRKNVGTFTTLANGQFSFSEVPAGNYILIGSKPGYLNALYDQHEAFTTGIVAGPGMATEGLVFRFTLGAGISGRVLDAAGDPVRNAAVTLFVETLWAGAKRIIRVGVAAADDRGYYEFPQLPPGKYFVSVNANPWYAVNLPLPPYGHSEDPAAGARGLEMTYPTTYFGGVTEAEQATPIQLKAGERAQADVTLTAMPALHVFVRTDPAGEMADALGSLLLGKHVFEFLDRPQSARFDRVAPGLYEISGVAPGRYAMSIGMGKDTKSFIDVDLKMDRQELDLSQLEPATSLKITVKADGNYPLPTHFQLSLLDKRLGILWAAGDPDASDVVWFSGVRQGRYGVLCTVRTNAYPAYPYAIVRTASSGEELTGNEINVTSTGEERTVWMVPGTASMGGMVRKNSKPLPGAMVILIPDDPGSKMEYLRRDQTNSDGTFTMGGIFPGRYSIVALEGAWDSEWWQSDTLSKYARQGQPITVTRESGKISLPEPIEVQRP